MFEFTPAVYQHNGVTISPAVHQFDGPVSLRLDWNGLRVFRRYDAEPVFYDNAQTPTWGPRNLLPWSDGEVRRRTAGDWDICPFGAGRSGCRPKGGGPEACRGVSAILIRPATRYASLFWTVGLATDFMVATPDTVVTRMAEVTMPSKHADFGKAERNMIMMADWLREAQLFLKVPSDRWLIKRRRVLCRCSLWVKGGQFHCWSGVGTGSSCQPNRIESRSTGLSIPLFFNWRTWR